MVVFTDVSERYIIHAIVILGNPSCPHDVDWYTAVAVHELGHVLGLVIVGVLSP